MAANYTCIDVRHTELSNALLKVQGCDGLAELLTDSQNMTTPLIEIFC